MLSIKINRVIALASLAAALIPAGLTHADDIASGPQTLISGSIPAVVPINPRSVDAAAMANMPCYFEGASILQSDLAAGPLLAQDPAQAASAQRISNDDTDTCSNLSIGCGAIGGLGVGGGGASIGSTAHSHGSGRNAGPGLNTYGNSGW